MQRLPLVAEKMLAHASARRHELGSGLSTLTLTLALTLSLTQIHLYIHHVVIGKQLVVYTDTV
jgi:hypothetical protein